VSLHVTAIWLGSDDPSDPRRARPAEGAAESGDRVSTRVLVVDDDPSILATVHEILVAEGYDVVAASGGAEAIALSRTWRPTLVLLDMRMPVVDGWAVARAMREIAPGVPIVVMTAAENAKRWAEEIAAEGYLAKPFQLDDLLRCVERFRGGQRSN
jgi:CheY-like chemotaxis protein